MISRLTTTLRTAFLVLALPTYGSTSARDKSTDLGAAIGGAALGGVIGNQMDPNKR